MKIPKEFDQGACRELHFSLGNVIDIENTVCLPCKLVQIGLESKVGGNQVGRQKARAGFFERADLQVAAIAFRLSHELVGQLRWDNSDTHTRHRLPVDYS